jgi:hypothetical protein
MNAKHIIFIFLILTFQPSFSQNPKPIDKFQSSIGYGVTGYGNLVFLGSSYFFDDIRSLGLDFSRRNYAEALNGKMFNHEIYGLTSRLDIHLEKTNIFPKGIDVYFGINLGFYYWNKLENYDGQFYSGFNIGAQVGGAYFFSNKMGIKFELLGPNDCLGAKIGLIYKLTNCSF